MGTRSYSIGLAGLFCLVLFTAGVPAQSPDNLAHPSQAKYTVHEWGTFLSVQGSDGQTLAGMVESDEALPAFVESRTLQNWQRGFFYEKMETPVTYFYTDRPLSVKVRVDMPAGLLTHWYPPVKRFGPAPGAGSQSDGASYLNWIKVFLTPDNAAWHGSGKDAPSLPRVDPEQTWRQVRQTDSALVRVDMYGGEKQKQQYWKQYWEKFLFYRGLGTFRLPLTVRSSGAAESELLLRIYNRDTLPARSLFAIRVQDGKISAAALGHLDPGDMRELQARAALGPPAPLAGGVPHAKSMLAEALVEAGLYPKEARAMVNTWERSYFHTEGLRLLYILPEQRVSAIIPIHLDPAPERLVRVMVGRIEVLTPERERQIAMIVRDLGAEDFKLREAGSSELARLGRIAEPALRRVMSGTRDAEIRARAEALVRRYGG
jgi:hypothetical protein